MQYGSKIKSVKNPICSLDFARQNIGYEMNACNNTTSIPLSSLLRGN